MERKGKAVCALLLVQLLAWGVFVPTADAGKMVRVSSQFRRFADDFDSTTANEAAGGIVVYTKSFSIPTPKTSGMQPVVYITLAAHAEQFSGTRIMFKCEIDGTACNTGTVIGGSGTPGWIALILDLESQAQAYGVDYTWCAKVSPGTRTATIRMASVNGTDGVFLAGAHFYIDRTEFKASTADDCELGAP